MNKLISDVMKIHKMMDAPLPDKTDYTHSVHRLRFLMEELHELIKAAGYEVECPHISSKIVHSFNEEEVIDGLVDLIYVAIGTAIYFGYTNKIENKTLLEHAWDRVQAANEMKVPVKNENESKRGVKFDLKKPEGWKKPVFGDLIKTIRKEKE